MTNHAPIKVFITFILCFFNISPQYSQSGFANMEFQNVQGAISQRPITAITQDKDGFIWIGTQGAGLFRYDGISFEFFTHNVGNNKSINSNHVSALYVDSSGGLWVGTDAGLCFFNNETNDFERIKGGNGVGFDFIHISCIAEFDGKLLIGTFEEGVKRVDLKKPQWFDSTFDGGALLGKLINDIKFSAKGNAYIATNQGLKLIENNNFSKAVDVKVSNEEVDSYVTRLFIDTQEQLWVGTIKRGLFKGDLKKALPVFRPVQKVEKRILSITGGLGNVFVGIENDGLLALDSNGNIEKWYRADSMNPKSIASDSVWSIFLGYEGRLWLGYYNDGVSVFDKNHNKFQSLVRHPLLEKGIQSNDLKGFAKSEDGKLWIAVSDGIDILDTNNNTIEHVNSNFNSSYSGLKKGIYIEDIFIDSKENVWIATWGDGIFYLKKGAKRFINYTKVSTDNGLETDKIRCFSESVDGNIWIGSFLHGVHLYGVEKQNFSRIDNESFTRTGLLYKDVKDVFADSYGDIWIGTTKGLFKVVLEDSKFVVEDLSNEISASFGGHPSAKQILSINQTQDGRVWFCTNGGGLFYFSKEENKFHRLQLKDFNQSFVNAVIEPRKNELWVCGKLGVFKINLENAEVVNFTTDDGLLNNHFKDGAVILDNKNRLYFGTNRGLNFIDPQAIDYNENKARPYFRALKVFNKDLKISKQEGDLQKVIDKTEIVTLNHKQSVFTIDYGAISYTRPEKNKFAYYLEGFEKDWNYVGNKTSTTYTNLSPGEYTFKLKVANNDNIWNKQVKTLKIKVLPPWWKTTIAYLLYGLSLMAIMVVIIYFSLRRVNERNTMRLERMKRKQEDELQKQKLQFFTNISHEFRTPLTLIINPVKDLLHIEGEAFSEGVSQKHRIIYKNAERLSRLINELMDFRKLQSDKLQLSVSQFDLISQTKNILSFFNEESKRRKITLDFKHDANSVQVWSDSGMLDKVFFNLLSNAFKVTPNKGKISVKVVSDKKKVMPLIDKHNETPIFQITVKDSGPGIDQKEYKRIFKRFYQISQMNKTYYGSTGVGLEMVKSFIELHRGEIEVESELGSGSSFIVSIPYGASFFETIAVKEEALSLVEEDIDSESQIYEIEDILSQKEKKKKLLIAEDNVDLQDYLVSVLGEEYDLIVAYDGQEAWLRAMEHTPDVIITDVIMPIMDGVEFCSKIKNDIKTSHIPVIMLTSKDLVEDRIKAIDVGADAYLIKPFELSELKAILAQLVDSRQRLLERFSNTPLDTPIEKGVSHIDNDFVQKVVTYIQENIENSDLNVETLSSNLFLSRSQMYRKIKSLTGLSPNEFIRRIRLERARTLLNEDRNMNISEVAFKVGFLSASYFTRCYKKQFGELPRNTK